ncbi:hypothetical protein [Aureimonas mangrovi]|uniref:hypothetical protein n=1 Tax=Aureimonas mangrovi TaxID=2758041 RepID=UPI00163DE175|nr:hypothetical protein [Aureimonas mangrovi]
MNIGTVSKGIAGAIAGMMTGNVGMIAMTTEQTAAMPWWGVIVANATYAAIGFLAVYIAPRNAD